MSKHLLIFIVPLLVVTGCDLGWLGWETCCNTTGQYCLADECSEGEGGGHDECDGLPTFYVWTTEDCGEHLHEVCATDLADAQSRVDVVYANVPHGAPAADPDSTRPKMVRVCGSGPGCTITASDGSQSTTFYISSDDQLAACEQFYDAGCSAWAPVDEITGACPAAL